MFLLLHVGCAKDEQQQAALQVGQQPMKGAECGDMLTDRPKSAGLQREEDEALDTSLLPESVTTVSACKGRLTEECYQLQRSSSQRKKKKWGRCEPQSLPFARCRSGINSCRKGWNNGPLTWFACEKKRGNSSLIPSPNSVLILAANKHNMPTGHVAYIEEVLAARAPHYRFIFSHTNYDRQCSLETGHVVEYNSSTRTMNILTGAWKDWGKELPVSGFILR
ncbi:MAG: hypothetical protein FP810_04135 [Desulfocapsa sp.]|nr:hypothetical protein [Desulfocapsa sp.]MBU3983649.1 CHAP domain-containing protein [Pseudomonadota bacterium]MBU4107754.1 CHAP domain-containing protein [Pseudomonadota bacterium]MBU4585476.1 CHAP domain-containing protein [Pseudomonadota bacterium]